MKKYLWIFFILILMVVIAVFVLGKNNDSKQQDSYNAERMSGLNENINANSTLQSNNVENDNDIIKNNEEIVSEFSTRLPKDTKSRDDNIKLACKTINGAVVKKGETFSFWKVLGSTTEGKGYQKAKTFKSNGEVTESYGGGVCQISTTIYNAVLAVKDLEVIERHEHSREVAYIEDGKDAAVSYGSADFRFKNNLDYDLKIGATVEDNKVKISLIRI